MIDPEAVQNRRIEVIDGHRITDNVVTEIVRLADRHPAFDAAAGHPHSEAARMVVAAVVVGGEFPLRIDSTPEFAAPDDQRVFQQAALLQVLDQRGCGLIGVAALTGDLLRALAVLVPAAMEQLNKAHAAFRQAARQNAICGKRARLARVGTVTLEHRLRLFRQICQFGHGRLHAKRHLVLRYACVDLRIAEGLGVPLVQFRQIVEKPAAHFGLYPGGFDKYSTGSRPLLKLHSLIIARRESRYPITGHTTAGRSRRQAKS